QHPGNDSSIFHCFPGNLQKQAMLGVHSGRFSWGNPEKCSIKLIHLFEEASITAHNLPRRCRTRIVYSINIIPVSRNLGNRVTSVTHQLPEGVWVRRSRKTAAHTNNSDSFHDFFFLIVHCLALVVCLHLSIFVLRKRMKTLAFILSP